MADKIITLGTKFTSDITEVIAAIKKLKIEMSALNAGMQGVGTKAATASKSVKSMSSAMQGASKDTKKLGEAQTWTGKQISKVSGAWERMKAAMKVTASYGLASQAIYGIYMALQSGVQEIINFDQGLKNLQAISGATSAQVAVMGDTIKAVAKSTKFSVVEVADGMVLLTQAGFSASEAMAAIKAVSHLATGTLASMQTTSDLLTTTIRAFTLEATEATRVADVMANAINKSKLTIDKLRISFNFVGSVAAQTGLSLEQTAASMMVLANSGLRASTIGTGLRQVLSRLMAPTGKLREAFEKHNIELSKVNPRLVGFQNAIKNLLPVMWDSEKGAVNMTKAFELFGLRGSQAAAILVKSFAGTEYDEMLSKVYDVGAAEAMAGIQAEGLGVQLKNLADRFKLVAVAAGEAGFANALGLLVEILKGVSIFMEAFAKNTLGATLIGWGAWSLAILGVAKSLKVVWGAMKLLAEWTGLRAVITIMIAQFAELNILLVATGARFATVKAAMIAFGSMLASLSPLAKFVLIVGTLATAFGVLSSRGKKAREALAKIVEENKAAVGSLRQYRNSLEDLNDKLEQGVDVTEQYTATIQRLREEHKDLVRYVNFNTASHEELNQAVKNMEFDLFSKSLDVATESLVAQIKHVDNLREEFEYLNVDNLAEVFLDLSDAGKKSFDEWPIARVALNALAGSMQDYTAALVYFVEIEKLTADEARKLIKVRFAAAGATDKATEALDRFNKALEKSGEAVLGGSRSLRDVTKEYEAYYNSLDLLSRAHLIEDVAKSQLAQKNLEDSLRKKLGANVEAEKLIGALIGEMQAKTLLKSIDSREKDKKNFKELVDYKKNELKAYYDAAESGRQVEIDTINAQYEELIQGVRDRADAKLKAENLTEIQIENIKKRARAKEKELEEKQNKELADTEEKHVGRMLGIQDAYNNISLEKTKKQGKSAAQLQLEEGKKQADFAAKIEFDKAKIVLEAKKQAAVGDKALSEQLDEKESALELRFMEESLVRHKVFYTKLKALKEVSQIDIITASYKLVEEERKIAEKKTAIAIESEKNKNAALKRAFEESLTNTELYSDAWVNIIKRMYMSGLSDTSEYIKQMTAYLDNLEDQWRDGTLAVEDYMRAVKQMQDEGVIDQEEYDKRRIESSGTFWEALKYGLAENEQDLLSWQEIVIAAGETFASAFASDATGALFDFIDGTKSAAVAFQDFARGVLRAVAEMIVKLMIQKALMSMMGMGGGFMNTGGMAGTGISSMAHGGIVGTPQPVRIVNPNVFANAKHYEAGGMIGASEVPIIAHRGEGVFTPEQMAALGGPSTIELTNVNIVDERALSQLLATSRGKSAMLNFIGENASMVKKVLARR